jgi:hypothetical protein
MNGLKQGGPVALLAGALLAALAPTVVSAQEFRDTAESVPDRDSVTD